MIVSNQLLVSAHQSDWLAEKWCYLLSASLAEMLLAAMATNSNNQYTRTHHMVNRDFYIREKERRRDRVFLLAHSTHA